MKTIQINVHNDNLDFLLSILQSLKDGIIESITVEPSLDLDIEVITPNDSDYKIILEGREHRKKHPEDYGTMSDIDWD